MSVTAHGGPLARTSTAAHDPIARSMQRLRVLAAATVAALALGLRSEADGTSVLLATGIVVGLLALNLLDRLMVRPDGVVRTSLIVVQLFGDLLLAVTAPWVLGVDPTSTAALVVAVPILEAGLRFRMLGTVVAWLTVSLVLAAHAVLVAGVADLTALGGVAQISGVLLVIALPTSYLAEHLVGQLVLTARSRHAAEQRAALLGVLTEATHELHTLDAEHIVEVIASAPLRFGSLASDVHLRTADGAWELVDHQVAPGARVALAPPGTTTGEVTGRLAGASGPDGLRVGASVLDVRPRQVLLRTVTDESAARLVEEAIDILVAEASVALRNAELHARLDRLAIEHERRARHDQLTGLLNRAGIERVLEERFAPGRRRDLSVLFLDLNDFKAVNDNHGHAAGDEVLCAVASRLIESAEADWVGRLGGDEFIAIYEGADAVTRATRAAAFLTAVITTPIAVGDAIVQVGASCGVATLERGVDVSPAQLLDRADRRMYEEKRRTRAAMSTPPGVSA